MWKTVCLFCAAATTLVGAETRLFEAEKVVVESGKLNRDRLASATIRTVILRLGEIIASLFNITWY